MYKAKDLRAQALEELEASLLDHQKKLFQLTNQARLEKKVEKPHLIRQTKKEIAMLLTVITEKQMANQKG
jgi:large subunit ribosomal protein L29